VRLLPERSIHAVAALEQRVSKDTRLRAEFYQRSDRDLIERPLLDPRIIPAGIVLVANPTLYNSARGYARGVQLVAQRRSANRLSGWIGYTLAWARKRDGVDGTHYWSRDDQRHTVNTYLGYRIRPSVHASGKWTYGSGQPIPGFFRRDGASYFLTSVRNEQRLDPYSRLDLRINKSFVRDRWKMTLYAELINATKRRNIRFISFDGADRRTGQAFVTLEPVMPMMPAGGITFEF
jgi:hypothetical protein